MVCAQVKRVLLCGGIGSGKSTVSRLLGAKGAVVIDADRVGHAVIEWGGEAHADVVKRWPQAVIDGRIDRGRLAGIVFADSTELAQLEELTHPHIRRRIEAAVEAAADRDVVVELPLLRRLVEGDGWVMMVVDAPDEVRRHRLALRGMAAGDIEARMRSQPSREEWLEAADVVVDNSGSISDLRQEVDRVWSRLEAG